MIYANYPPCADTCPPPHKRVSRLGFGTTRFHPEDLRDRAGLGRCVELVEYAIERGVNYFDAAPTYANGHAEKILGEAFRHCAKPVYVSAKTGLLIDRTSEDVMRRLEQSLRLLNRDKIDFYHIWSVMNLDEFHEVMRKGGLYEGFLKAKEEGLIDHICISLHCSVEDTVTILDQGLFEGAVISANVMNYKKWSPVFDLAREKNIALVTMNSLAGGMVPQYPSLFELLDTTDDPVSVKALRYMRSFPEISVLLSGMSSKEMIDENIRAFEETRPGGGERRKSDFELKTNDLLCTGCNYCAPCTVGIPISACMQAYNHKIFVETAGCTDDLRLVNEMFIRMRANGVVFPDLKKCISCGKCERKCTQKIPISTRMKKLGDEAALHGYTNSAMRARLRKIEDACMGSKQIGIWPASDYATRVLDFWDNPEFEKRCCFFNSSPALHGGRYRGKRILSAEDIEASGADTILIMHYRLQSEIYAYLTQVLPRTIKIICLHRNGDINWFDRMI